jgi:membrane fusion protein (multidrug efflux system)
MSTTTIIHEGQQPVQSPEKASTPKKWYAVLSKAQWCVASAVAISIAAFAALHVGRVSTNDAQIEAHVITIAPHVPGYVQELKIDDNWKLKTGQVLFTIDPRDYQVRLEQTTNAYETAAAQEKAARVGIGVAQNVAAASTQDATASLTAQQANLAKDREAFQRAAGPELEAEEDTARAKQAVAERAARDLERYRPLVKTGEISELQFDSFSAQAKVAESEAAQAQALVEAARHAVAIANSQVAISGAGIDRARASLTDAHARVLEAQMRIADWNAAEATVGRAKAQMDEARLNLSYTNVVSPLDGVVTHRTVEVGQYVQAGQAMLQIIPLDDVWVIANFKETQLAHVRPGQRARIHIDTYGMDVEGWVDSIAASTGARQALLPPENATGNYVKVVERIPVKLRVRDSRLNGALRPGMNVEVTIYTR